MSASTQYEVDRFYRKYGTLLVAKTNLGVIDTLISLLQGKCLLLPLHWEAICIARAA